MNFFQKIHWRFSQKDNGHIGNPAYASNFITTSQKEKLTNEITRLSRIL
jgi:hypothetical protein